MSFPLVRLVIVPTLAAVCLLASGCGSRNPSEIGKDPLSEQINKSHLEYYGKGFVRVQEGETRSEESLMNTARQRALSELSATFDQRIARTCENTLNSQASLQGAGIDPKDKDALEKIRTNLKTIGDTVSQIETSTNSTLSEIAGVAFLTAEWKDEDGKKVFGAVAYIHGNHIDQYRDLINTRFTLLQSRLKNEADGLSSDSKAKYEAAIEAAKSGVLKEAMDQAAKQAAADKASYEQQLAKAQADLAQAQASGQSSQGEVQALKRQQDQLQAKVSEAEKLKQEAEAKAAEDLARAKQAEARAAATKPNAGL